MSLKERVQQLCRQKGVTAQNVEMQLGFSKGYISKLDKSTPNSARLQKIADYFGVSYDYLMARDENNSSPTIPHAQYREILSEGGIRLLLDEDANVPDENIEDIIKYIRLRQGQVGR